MANSECVIRSAYSQNFSYLCKDHQSFHTTGALPQLVERLLASQDKVAPIVFIV
jgi:hypothetical protein